MQTNMIFSYKMNNFYDFAAKKSEHNRLVSNFIVYYFNKKN